MKRKLLFAMLCIVSALGQLRAQTDVTSTYITNPSFEADGNLSAGNGTNPNIITPTGWTQEQNTPGSFQDNKICDASTSNGSNYGTTVTPSDGTYYLFYRHGWNGNNYAKFTSTASTLPVGSYKLTVDYKMVSGSDNTSNNDNTAITLSAISGETTLGTTTAKGAVKVNNAGTTAVLKDNDWITLETTFSLDAETSTQFVINLLACGPKRSDFVVDNVRLYYTPITRPTAIALNETALALNPTQSSTLSVTYTPADANTDTDITWTSSDATVATVDGGVVTAVGAGSATITATTANNVSTTCAVTVTDVTPVTAPAFYSEVADGDFYIVNAATGKAIGMIKSGWGTQAGQADHGIPFTVALGEGVYTLDSHTYNSDQAHFFNGIFVDGSSTNLYITSLGSGKYSISTADGSAFVTANVNDKVIANTAPTANSVLAQWYFVSKANIESAMASATTANPVDATFYIQDPDFSRNHWPAGRNTSSWTMEASNKNLKGGDNGNMCAESYHSTFTLSQTLTVKNGMYKFRAQACENVATPVAVLYANDETTSFKAMAKGENSMSGCSAQFTAGNYYTEWIEVNVTDNTLTVGVKSTSASNWCVWDNFELYYLGPTVGGEATEIPMATETAMTAGSWYYFDIPVDGLYNLTTTTLSDIVYTNDATVLIENESSVTATFSQAENETLTAGRYYVKSTTAQSLEVSVGAYAYNVGAATLSATDGAYTQSSTFTVTFPAAATSDPAGAAALVASSTATVNGNTIALTAATNGFSLDLGTLTESSDYVIAIPANVYGYAGNSMNEAINVTLHTPVVFDGEYVLYDATNKLFLGRGAGYGTEAVADKYGVPVNLTTDATGASNVQFVDNDGYLFIASNGVYTDGGVFAWTVNPATDGYTLSGVFNEATKYLTHAAGGFGEYVTTADAAGSATVWTLKTLAERDAIIAEYPTENINNVITASGVATTADAFATFLSNNYNAIDCTSAIGTATFAGAAGDWTWTSYWRNEKGQPAYGTNFVEAWNATGAWTQTIDKANLPAGIYKITVQGYERRKANEAATALYTAGYNLVSTFLSANGEQVRFTDWNDVAGKPTNTGGAVTAFTNGEATNEVYVYLDGNTDLSLMIRKPNYIFDCWVIWNNITLTRYEQTEATMKISDAQYATFVAPFDVTIPSGVTAYTVDGVTGTTLDMTELTTTIPANTPVVLYKESALDATTFYGKTVAGEPTEGLLTGVYTSTVVPVGSYVLQKNNEKVAFYLVEDGEQPTANANRAYLTLPAAGGVKAAAYYFGTATAIRSLFSGLQNGDVYDLAGRKVQKMQKGGVYIVNGQKVVVK